jgi:hypothetical protein
MMARRKKVQVTKPESVNYRIALEIWWQERARTKATMWTA